MENFANQGEDETLTIHVLSLCLSESIASHDSQVS